MLKQVVDTKLLGVKVLIDPHGQFLYFEDNYQDKRTCMNQELKQFTNTQFNGIQHYTLKCIKGEISTKKSSL
jgi:hypothetical protein